MARDRPPLTPVRLGKAVAGLSPLEREVLTLSARERLSNDDIAARLGIKKEAAERLLAAALCTLDRALEPQERPWWRFW
jgi:DNA-directed RNA polymerase specialized sigma24 family protein